MSMKGYFVFPKTSGLFRALSRTQVGGSYPSAEKQSVYSTAPADWAIYIYREREKESERELFLGDYFSYQKTPPLLTNTSTFLIDLFYSGHWSMGFTRSASDVACRSSTWHSSTLLHVHHAASPGFHYRLKTNEAPEDKAEWEIHKDTKYYFKTKEGCSTPAAVLTIVFHLTKYRNKTNKTYRILLEMWGLIQKPRSVLDCDTSRH